MRIIFLSPHSDPRAKLGEPDAGGQCIYEHELAIALAKNGDEVLTFCRQRNRHQEIERIIPGYTIHRITAGGDKFIPKEEIGRVLPEFTMKTATILSDYPLKTPTIINSHYWDGVKAALMLKANYRDYPMVWTPHSLGFSKRNKFKGLSQELRYQFVNRLTWENYGAMAADHLIVLSRSDKMKLIRNYAVMANRITILAPGISFDEQDIAIDYKQQWGIANDTKIILSIGRIARTKGYHHLIRILARLQLLYAGKVVLVIVGGQSQISSSEEKKYRYELKKLAQTLGVEQQVIFQPSVPHEYTHTLYQLADLYMMASEDEPFGLTLVEAMANGRAVIAHNQGGTKDILLNGITGIIADMHKYEAVAAAAAKLFTSKTRLRNLGLRAMQAAHTKYSWDSRIQQYQKVYQSALETKVPRLPRLLSYDYALKESLRI